jgi:hypothetical protein
MFHHDERSGIALDAAETRPHLYYDTDGVQVTAEAFWVDGQPYDLAAMRYVRGAHGPRSTVRVSAGLAACLVLGGVALIGRHLGPGGWFAAAVAFAIPVVIVSVSARTSPRSHELWCDYHGFTVRLLWTNDRYRYARITRAITRARNDRPAPRPAVPAQPMPVRIR